MAQGRGLQPFQACKLKIQEFNLFDKNDSLIKIVPMFLLVLRSSYIKLRDCNFASFLFGFCDPWVGGYQCYLGGREILRVMSCRHLSSQNLSRQNPNHFLFMVEVRRGWFFSPTVVFNLTLFLILRFKHHDLQVGPIFHTTMLWMVDVYDSIHTNPSAMH
jgi:hypothetical protein